MDSGDELGELSDRDNDRSRRRKKKFGKRERMDEETPTTGLTTTPARPTIILAKPASEWPAPSRAQEKTTGASPTRLISSPLSISPAAEAKTIVMLRQREDSRGAQTIPSLLAGDGQLPQTPPQYLMQRKSAPSTPLPTEAADGPNKLANPPEMTQSIKLVDDMLNWCDAGMDVLLDQTDFLTIGVLGLQGAGKSTVLSALGGNLPHYKNSIFRPQSREVRDVGRHMTNGLDMCVTNERIILLDSQPVLSPSLVDQLGHNDRKFPSEFSSVENYVEMQSLQIATFMMTVCNVVIVVLDWFVDLSVLKFLLTAEMLKPPKPSSGHEGSRNISEDGQNFHPHLIFVLNKASREDFSFESQQSMQTMISQIFDQSKLKFRGGINGSITEKGSDNFTFTDTNLILLPVTSSQNKEIGLGVSRNYEGIPSFEHQINILRNAIYSIPRIPLTHTTLSEKNWFHYSARTWDAVKKSQLLAEYNRLLL